MKGVIAGCALGLTLSAIGVAHAASQSAVYCTAGKPSFEFAGRIDADGGLFFGLSIWDEHGDNSFMYGKARKLGDHWLYVAQKPEYDPRDAPCRLEVW